MEAALPAEVGAAVDLAHGVEDELLADPEDGLAAARLPPHDVRPRVGLGDAPVTQHLKSDIKGRKLKFPTLYSVTQQKVDITQ